MKPPKSRIIRICPSLDKRLFCEKVGGRAREDARARVKVDEGRREKEREGDGKSIVWRKRP